MTTAPAKIRASAPEAGTARDDPVPRVASGLDSGLARVGQMLLQMQGQYGNRYVRQVVDRASQGVAPPVRAKLLLGPAGDRYEQEADRVAERAVATGPEAGPAARSHGTERHGTERHGTEPLDARLAQAVQRARHGGRPLPAPVREPMERALGADLTGVRAHTDAQADLLNRCLGARAFTTGQDIFFRRGNYDPAGQAGQRLLAHELTHVAQQNTGPAVVQRYLFSNYTSPASVQEFKQKYGPPRADMVFVFHSLDQYVAQHPQQPAGTPIKPLDMTADQLRLTRGLLLNLQQTIDTAFAESGLTMDVTQTEGATRLRVLTQNELGKVVAYQATRREFARPEGYQRPTKRQRRTNVATFTDWLTTHPVYRKWEHQGAGACAAACRDLLRVLRSTIFRGDQRADRVKVRGIKVTSPLPGTGPANHFVLVARVGGQRLVIDPTMGQFLGGAPGVQLESAWEERFRRSKVAFTNDEYLKPASVQWQDFDTVDQAVAYAPLHG